MHTYPVPPVACVVAVRFAVEIVHVGCGCLELRRCEGTRYLCFGGMITGRRPVVVVATQTNDRRDPVVNVKVGVWAGLVHRWGK
jgi:hypothetical protein